MGQFSQMARQLAPDLSLFGSLLEAQGLRAEGEGAQAAARYNARLAESEGLREEARIRREGQRYLASRESAGYKGGVALEGTSLAALVADAETLEREALTARTHGFDTARLERAGGRLAAQTGRRAAVGSILSGGAKALDLAYRLRRPAGAPRPGP